MSRDFLFYKNSRSFEGSTLTHGNFLFSRENHLLEENAGRT